MSSGFVAAGTTDDPVKSNDEWEKAKQELDENKRRREEAAREEGGKSLYDVLQANKAAKQEAFEESIRLKNQFRSLDEDEVEFLDSVLESTRAKEEVLKKETTEQLDVFRKQQEEADKAFLSLEAATTSVGGGIPEVEQEQWAVSGRKRKKGGDKEVLPGVKKRKLPSTGEKPIQRKSASPPPKPTFKHVQGRTSDDGGTDTSPATAPKRTSLKAADASSTASKPASSGGILGLAYDSDDDGE